jgi:hypothetical protein
MPNLNIGQQGTLKSTPKIVRINGDDDKKVIYRNMGNNHAYPFVWASTATMPLGDSSMVVASGIKWHGYDLATYATVIATPQYDAGNVYVSLDTAANTITLNVETAPTVSGLNSIGMMFMLGNEMVVEGLYCRGNDGAAQNLP